MKTQKRKLTFKKGSVVELNSTDMASVNGGTLPLTYFVVASSWGCAAAAGAAVGAGIAYITNN